MKVWIGHPAPGAPFKARIIGKYRGWRIWRVVVIRGD